MRIDDGIAFRIEGHRTDGRPVARLAGPATRVALASLAVQRVTLRQDRVIGAGTGIGSKASHEHVHVYTTKHGTSVKSHDRSTRDGTKKNNWSTKGNANPETGKAGTK